MIMLHHLLIPSFAILGRYPIFNPLFSVLFVTFSLNKVQILSRLIRKTGYMFRIFSIFMPWFDKLVDFDKATTFSWCLATFGNIWSVSHLIDASIVRILRYMWLNRISVVLLILRRCANWFWVVVLSVRIGWSFHFVLVYLCLDPLLQAKCLVFQG